MGRHSSEDKPADMCQVSHTAGLYLRDGTGVHKLREEPDTDQERRRINVIRAKMKIKRTALIRSRG
jgi:hypothetical protein